MLRSGKPLLLPAPPRLAGAGRGGQRARRARPCDPARARPALSADQPCRARHRLHRHRRPRRRRHGARVRQAICPIPRRAAQPLVLSIDSRVQQALEHELLRRDDHFSAIGAAGVVMDVHTGEVLAMTSLPAAQSERAGRRARPTRASTARRSASTSSARPSSRSPSRWRWTSGVIKSFGQMYNCPHELPVYGHVVHDTHPFGRHAARSPRS